MLICNSVIYLHKGNHLFTSLIIHMGGKLFQLFWKWRGGIKTCISYRRSPVVPKSNPLYQRDNHSRVRKETSLTIT